MGAERKIGFGLDRFIVVFLVLEGFPSYAAEIGGSACCRAAAEFHYGVAASAVHRDQAARLAAILPHPIRRKPARMNQKAEIILTRVRQMEW